MQTVLVVDKFGRIALPKRIREEIGCDEFIAEIRQGELHLRPAPSWNDMKGASLSLT